MKIDFVSTAWTKKGLRTAILRTFYITILPFMFGTMFASTQDIVWLWLLLVPIVFDEDFMSHRIQKKW